MISGGVLTLFCLCSVAYAPASDDSNANFTLNLADSNIHALIDAVSKQTGKNFVVDPRVNGRVTVISNTPVNATELYEMFLSVLQVHGFAAVPAGRLTKNCARHDSQT